MRRYNPDTQKCIDIEKLGSKQKVRVYCKEGTTYEGYPNVMTYVELDPDDDEGFEEDAISLFRPDMKA